MKMRKIWRLEHKDGAGIYASGIAVCVMESILASARHPMPHDDVGLRDVWGDVGSCDWYFGFASLAQYRAWFFKRAHRKAFEMAGAVLRLYVVPAHSYHRGMNQAIFIRAQAHVVQERSPDI